MFLLMATVFFNCLFHTVCDQLRKLKIARMRHGELQKRVVEHLRNNPTVVILHHNIKSIMIIH